MPRTSLDGGVFERFRGAKMRQKLINEDQLLDLAFRKLVIEEITGSENRQRKTRELRKYEIYKDNTRKWVIESLTRELSPETVAQMENRASNISIARKIVDKLARSYVGGVERKVEDKTSQSSIDELGRLLEVNAAMKKGDRYLELFKNTMVQVIPEKIDVLLEKYRLKLRVLPPFMYDVIEDVLNPEKPRVVVLTDFIERNRLDIAIPEGTDGRGVGLIQPAFSSGDRRDQTIADSPEDAGQQPNKRTFIWWSDKYHFTTDSNGEIIAQLTPEEQLNPIQKLPFVNLAEDQDGEFWARGGDDLVDGSILINVLLTDLFGIANAQGWGQMVIKGKNLPKVIKGGPHRAIVLDYEEGDPVPDVTFQTSNPPLDAWMRMVEQYVALLLSTNNLAPSNIASKLDASTFPSGIAMLIEQSESTAEVEDKQKLFADVEPKLWDVIKLWHDFYFERKALIDELMAVKKFSDSSVVVKFSQSKPPITEQEKINNLKARKDLGIDTMVDLIRLDNPQLTEKEAEEKLMRILEEKLKLQSQRQDLGLPTPPTDPNKQDQIGDDQNDRLPKDQGSQDDQAKEDQKYQEKNQEQVA